MMTGANPNTGWLENCVALDEKEFVKAAPDLTPRSFCIQLVHKVLAE